MATFTFSSMRQHLSTVKPAAALSARITLTDVSPPFVFPNLHDPTTLRLRYSSLIAFFISISCNPTTVTIIIVKPTHMSDDLDGGIYVPVVSAIVLIGIVRLPTPVPKVDFITEPPI